MTNTCNWGIIGLGKIARKFAEDLRLVPGARLHAVASTSLERAQAFGGEFGAEHAFGTYQEMATCPQLDAVYVATPHPMHCQASLICLQNNIPVLCEKPFAMNAGEAREMIDCARQHNTFLMEALWTRFIPAFEYAMALVEQGVIGDVHTVKADFGFKMPLDPASRLFNKDLGGGALLDIGIYPALLALSVLGKPPLQNIHAVGTYGSTDVDENCAFTFQYPGGQMALGHATVAAHTPVEAWILGTSGSIYLHPRWHHTQRLTIAQYEDRQEIKKEVSFPYEGWGYHFEIAHVMQCLREGRSESDRVPLNFTLDLMETLDAIGEKMNQARGK